MSSGKAWPSLRRLCDDIGIFLIHSHWRVAQSEVLLERTRYDDEWRRVYATSRTLVSDLWRERVAPWRFMLLN